MKQIPLLTGLASLCAALLTAGCGNAAPAQGQPAPSAADTPSAAATSAVTSASLSVETLLPDESADSDDEADDDDSEYGYDYDYADEDENEPVSLSIKKSDIDPNKPFDPDESELGKGKESFAYPMNSIMLTVRQAPYDSSKKRTRLLSGTKVTLLANDFFSFSDCWSYISYDGGRGWCHANDLTAARFEWVDFTGVELPQICYDHADFSEGIYDVTADGAALMTAPDGESRGVIRKGTTVRAFGETKSAKGRLFVAASAEYLDTGGTGELYGWVKSDKLSPHKE